MGDGEKVLNELVGVGGGILVVVDALLQLYAAFHTVAPMYLWPDLPSAGGWSAQLSAIQEREARARLLQRIEGWICVVEGAVAGLLFASFLGVPANAGAVPAVSVLGLVASGVVTITGVHQAMTSGRPSGVEERIAGAAEQTAP
jgi:hypothetical protein